MKPSFFLTTSLLATVTTSAFAQTPTGWIPTWSDEFNGSSINTSRWDVLTRVNNFNNEEQVYLPEMASIAQTSLGGVDRSVLRITSTDQAWGSGSQSRDYRSARLESNTTQLYGRFEVMAKIPTTKGIWPAIWLLPRDTDWPTGGEIDIMEHAGSQPGKVSSAYHWGNNPGGPSNFVFDEHITGTQWPDAYHLYSVEWSPEEIRYFVDDTLHFTVTNAMAPISSTPMSVILNTAVGGWFDGSPNGSTVFPQHFDIDYVRVYEKSVALSSELLNGAFEPDTSGWTLAGNTYHHQHNLGNSPSFTAIEGSGGHAIKMFGAFGGPQSTLTQGQIAASEGELWSLSAFARVNSDDSIAGTSNRVVMSLSFFNESDQQIGSEDLIIADGQSLNDLWTESTLEAVAPNGTSWLQTSFTFFGNQGGAVWLDEVELFAPLLPGDANGDGVVGLLDLDILGANWGTAGASLTDGDFNGDGVVTLLDLDILGANWGATSGSFEAALAASGIVIPEPTGLSLLAVAGALLAGRRRRMV